MRNLRSTVRFVGLSGLAMYPLLVPLACALEEAGTKVPEAASSTGGGTSGTGGSGGMGGSGGTGGSGGSAGMSSSTGNGGSGGAICGNSMVELGEECDDGNEVHGDGCTGCMRCTSDGEFWDEKTWHCYTYVGIDRDWFEAGEDCKFRNGSLVGISSLAELEYILSKTSTDIWTGGNDRDLECVFKWSNGEPWFATWAKDEPNDYNGAEECVTILSKDVKQSYDDKFNDSNCGTKRDYLCERVPKGTCGDGIVQLNEDCDDGNFVANDGCYQCERQCEKGEIKDPASLHCYRFVTDAKKNWADAEKDCAMNVNPGRIAAINSPDEADFIKANLKAETWIGGQRKGSKLNWTTHEPSCWQNWADMQPSSENGCVVANADGKWSVLECMSARDYVCERSLLGD